MRYLSLFSGMEAAHIAWAPLGWECVGVAEIDPAACALLRHRLPGVPNLGSVTDITDGAVAKLGRIDVVIGGSPCQDLSVAGKRAGLSGSRSSLFHEQLRIFHAARTLCGARWLVWENVPGAFSSNKGRDFAVVVGEMAGCRLAVPAEGWGNEGVALGDNGLVEWSVLDSQWFGVAQRRRRVFAVLDTGDWANRPPVLLEPDRLRGDSAPRREAGQSVAGTLAGGARRSSGYSTDDVWLVPSIARCVTTGEGARLDGESCTFIPETCGTICADSHPGAYTGQDAYTGRLIPEVAHTLRADGFDASEDGTGRGTPLVPVAFNWQGGGIQTTLGYDPDSETTGTLHVGQVPAIAFGCKDSDPARSLSNDVAPTLRAMGHADSHANAGGQLAVAIGCDTYNGSLTGEVAATLSTQSGDGVSAGPSVMQGMAVRRLTPVECERLQAAPDNWTLVPKLGRPRTQRKNEPDAHYAAYLERHSGGVDLGPMMADGPRYKMLGNSFTATVIRWIGHQIEAAHGNADQQREAA